MGLIESREEGPAMLKRNVLRMTTVLAVLGALTLAGLATQAGAQGRADWALAHAMAVQEAHTETLLAQAGVVGTAVGHDRAGQPVVRVFVVDAADAATIPRQLDGVPVAVDVTGEIVALSHTTSRYRPAPIGVSTGHPDITAGTIGCRVKDASGAVYALSNNHVYADENRADIGDDVLQPGAYDGGTDPADAIGTLADFQPIAFCNPYPSNCPNNTIDAAIALSSTVNLGKATLSGGYGTPKSTPLQATVGLRVQKYGRTTSLTKGRVYAINATVNVGYDTGVARFVGQLVITPGNFSAGGDSGSLIVVQGGGNDRRPVGLLFAGSPSVTIANPIGPVLSRFGVTIDGQ
jgi:hypothetical protein